MPRWDDNDWARFVVILLATILAVFVWAMSAR